MESDVQSLLRAFYEKALTDQSSPERTVLLALSVLQDAFSGIDDALDPRTGRFLPVSLEALSDSLNTTLLRDFNIHHDRIYRLLKFLEQPIEEIINSPRDKIIRNHELTSPGSARGFDSRAVRWLIKRPGRTSEEKFSLTKKVLAVKRKFVCDTSENRLFKEVLKTLKALIELRIDVFTQFDLSFEHRLLVIISKWLRDNSDIGPWNNLPPNNILLQDKNYRKIWDAWGEIRVISEFIKNDIAAEKQYKVQMMFLVLLATLQKHGVRFCSQPFIIDYNFDSTSTAGLSMETIEKNIDLHGLAKLKDDIKFAFVQLKLSGDKISLDIGKFTHIAITHASVEVDSSQIPLEKGNLFLEVKQLINRLVALRKIRAEQPPILQKAFLPSGTLTIDFNAGFPIWSTNEKPDQPLPYFHARQYWSFDQQQCSFPLSIGQIWQMHPSCRTYSMANLLWSNIPCDNPGQVADDLVADLFEKKSSHDEITVLLPDILDDLDDNSICLKRSIGSFLSADVLYLPTSIAAVFAVKDLWGKVKPGDCFFVLESFDSKLTVTQVTAKKVNYSRELQERIPETCGIIWERHHTELLHTPRYKTRSVRVENLTTKILTPMYSNKHWEFPGQKVFCGIHTLSKSEINHLYSQTHGNARFIILSPGIRVESRHENVIDLTMNDTSQIRYISHGGETLRDLSKLYPDNPLWTDDLPALNIQAPGTSGRYQNIELVSENHAPITANRRNEILLTTIERLFSLNAGKSKQVFLVTRETGNTTERYQARVFLKNPPSQKIVCQLRLYYTYGAAEPYRLEFVPLKPEQAGFKTVNAQLSKDSNLKREDYENPYAAPSFDCIQNWDNIDEKAIKYFMHYDLSWWQATKELFNDRNYLQTHSRSTRLLHIKILDNYDVLSDHGRIPVYKAAIVEQDKKILFMCHKILSWDHEYEAIFDNSNELQFSFDKIRCVDGFNYETSSSDDYIQGEIRRGPNISINTPDCANWNFALAHYNKKRGITYIGAISDTKFEILRGVYIRPCPANQHKQEKFLSVLFEPDFQRIMLVQEQPVSDEQFADIKKRRCEECIRDSRSLFAGERRIWAEDIPVPLKEFFEKNVNGLSRLLTENTGKNDYYFVAQLGRFITFFGTNIPDDFGTWAVDSLRKNPFLYLFYGLSIGKMEKNWQKDLWWLILKKWHVCPDNKTMDGLIRVSERALRHPELISTVSYKDGKQILNTLKKRIASLTQDVVNARKANDYTFAENAEGKLRDLLWLLLTLLRLRKSDDERIKNLLYPGNMREFSSQLQILLKEGIDFQIVTNRDKKSLVSELINYFDGINPDTVLRVIDEDD